MPNVFQDPIKQRLFHVAVFIMLALVGVDIALGWNSVRRFVFYRYLQVLAFTLPCRKMYSWWTWWWQMPANRNTDPAPDRSNRGSEASLLISGEPGDDDDDNGARIN